MGLTMAGMTTMITFGKYKGWLVNEILEMNPEYLIWMQDNIDFFILKDYVYEKAVEKVINKRNKEVINHSLYNPYGDVVDVEY